MMKGVRRAAVATALLTVPSVASLQAQEMTTGTCFGISFQPTCGAMVHYEAGFRLGVSGSDPVTRGLPSRRAGNRWFIGVGALHLRSPHTAIGAVIDLIGTGDNTGLAAGARYARGFSEGARVDLGAGLAWAPLGRRSGASPRDAGGVFAEGTLHSSNAFSLSLRGEAYPGTRRTTPGKMLYVGVRAEETPGIVATLVLGTLYYGLATGLKNW